MIHTDHYELFLNEYVYTPDARLWADFTRLDGGRNLIDTGEFEYPNLITNSTFEPTNLVTWSKTAANNGNWTGTNATVADETSTVKVSTHSVKVTATAGGCFGYQNVGASGAHASTTITVGVWTYSNVANNGDSQIGLADDDGEDLSTGHKTAGFVWEVASRTTDGSPGQLYVKFIPGDALNDDGVFDGCICVEASSLIPTRWTLAGAGAVCHYDHFSKIGDYSVALERNGANTGLYLSVITVSANTPYTLGGWINSNSANSRYQFVDNDSGILLIPHSGGGDWEFVSDSIITGSSATFTTVYCSIHTTNALAYFDSPVLVEGSSLIPDWVDTNCESAPTGDQYKIDSYSMRVVGTAAGPYTAHTIGASGAYAGKSMTLAGWVMGLSTNSAAACLSLKDDDSTSSSTGTQTDAWVFETVTKALDASPGQLYAYCDPGGDGDEAYFDGIKLYREAGIVDGTRHTGINIMGAYKDGMNGWQKDGVDDYLYIPAADSGHLNFIGDFHIAYRFTFNQTGAIQELVSRGEANVSGYRLFVDANDKVNFTTNQSGATQTTTSGEALEDGKTYTIIASLQGDGCLITQNGHKPAYDATGSHIAPATSAKDFCIGKYSASHQYWAKTHDKALLAGNRPLGAVEQAEIARELAEVCP